jgi:hypothetical protein
VDEVVKTATASEYGDEYIVNGGQQQGVEYQPQLTEERIAMCGSHPGPGELGGKLSAPPELGDVRSEPR